MDVCVSAKVSCPSCGRPKTKLAKLCAACRAIANKAGEGVILKRLTPGQMRAFYAKANRVDEARQAEYGTAKAAALERAGVESTTLLTEMQASDAIDWLENQLKGGGPS